MDTPRVDPVLPRVPASVGRKRRGRSGTRDFADELAQETEGGESVPRAETDPEEHGAPAHHAPGEAGEHLDVTA